MKNLSLDGIRSFLAVAQHGSFSAAARSMLVTPTALSKAIKLLERQHNVLLFQRTTRSVALTEAGASLYAALAPATARIDDAFSALTLFRDRPAGRLRLSVPRAFGALVMAQVMPTFRRDFPDVTIDLALDDGAIDLVQQGFDAGIRLGQSVAQDMVAVRLTPDLHWSVVASLAYLDAAGRPRLPGDVMHHATLDYRHHRSGALHRWRFIVDGSDLYVETGATLVVNDTGLLAEFARAGLGLAYLADIEIAADLASGRLERVLQAFVPPTSGLFLYFPAHAQRQPKLRAFIDCAVACMTPAGSVRESAA